MLGSGASMGFIDPKFFDGKLTIGTNNIWKYFKVDYSLFKHEQYIPEAYKSSKSKIIASLHDCGDLGHPKNESLLVDYVFTHKRGRFESLEEHFQENLDAVGQDDDIFVSYSTITSCIHIAAYMGAKNIILCGHDCGYLDGVSHVKEYADHIKEFHKEGFIDYHNMWFERVSEDTRRLKAKLIEVYRCNIYSLNPFINFRLEGHKFSEKLPS